MTRRWFGWIAGAWLLAGAAPAQAWQVPDLATLPDTTWGRTVRQGRELIVNTAKLIGPQASDPAQRYSGSTLTCENCHLQAGTKEYGLPLVGVFADFPQYRAREGRVGSIEERIEGCMTRSMNGRPLPLDGPEMRAMVAYLKFLSTGVPVGTELPGRGSGKMPLLSRAADPVHGAAVFAHSCAICHGSDGAGTTDRWVHPVPPLWGPNSFNDGAGMNRLIAAASFIHNNMPYGITFQAPALAEADAWDVAAFVISQPRPVYAPKLQDFPNLKQKPVDVAFGPYPDAFSETEHRFGPYPPIQAARQKPPAN